MKKSEKKNKNDQEYRSVADFFSPKAGKRQTPDDVDDSDCASARSKKSKCRLLTDFESKLNVNKIPNDNWFLSIKILDTSSIQTESQDNVEIFTESESAKTKQAESTPGTFVSITTTTSADVSALHTSTSTSSGSQLLCEIALTRREDNRNPNDDSDDDSEDEGMKNGK